MSKRLVFVLCAVASLVAVPAFAGAKPRAKSHPVSLSGVIDTLSSTGAVGVPGTRETDSGILDGTVSGHAIPRAAFYQTATWGSGLKLSGRGRIFSTRGSVAFKATSTFTVNPNATESYTGKLTITGGTGLFKNAHGTAKISGTVPTAGDDDSATLKLIGKIIY